MTEVNIPHEWRRDGFTISTDKDRLDVELIHGFLSQQAYWAQGRPLDVVRRSIENSLPFGVYQGEQQVGFARVVTDYATFAWLADVFIVDEWRGQGLSKWLTSVIMDHPQLQGFRRWILATRDAHELYRRFGFEEIPEAWRFMEILREQDASGSR